MIINKKKNSEIKNVPYKLIVEQNTLETFASQFLKDTRSIIPILFANENKDKC